MYCLFLILNDVYKLDALMEDLYQAGAGATIIDSLGMGKVLIEHDLDIPIFSGLRRLVENNKPYNKTIISVFKDKEKLDAVIEKFKVELDYFKHPGVGFMFVLPVLECHGSKAIKD
ncbi:hypothetical protein [Clostridiisalibacter paucivorans]|uniref:hypothetical protein n=1 Tax=Clostridiisalibacter paucivorans TaxID=408753 RepID=UPI00047E8EBD|nr:hypothetical protein [Clostridiisalibacter paucivorans]